MERGQVKWTIQANADFRGTPSGVVKGVGQLGARDLGRRFGVASTPFLAI